MTCVKTVLQDLHEVFKEIKEGQENETENWVQCGEGIMSDNSEEVIMLDHVRY